ncbi:hypothetical protein VdG1_00660 [Verticillium dahliae VDG1]|nr:hypothetical protein VdG1_00660 [Verticillium dahliae VDG1]
MASHATSTTSAGYPNPNSDPTQNLAYPPPPSHTARTPAALHSDAFDAPANGNGHDHDPYSAHLRQNTLANAHTSHPIYPQQAASSLAVPSSNHGRFTEEWDASQRGSSIIDGHTANNMQRSNSYASNSGEDHLSLPSRGNTLKKKGSLRRNASLKRSGSRRSMNAGSVRSLALQSTSDPDEAHSAFHCPVPTTGNPTEVLANRFQSWRKVLKDLIAYYREIQSHYETKAKSLVKLANVANNISTPAGFLASGGLVDAMEILRVYHKDSIVEANKAREIEEDVILALTGLRSDLHQKIKEIKSLSGDFKNSVEKEMDATRKLVKSLQEAIGQSDADPASTTGKQDPYLLRLAVDRQVERQIDEENYLHQAYLNLEASGRELESIVVGEIQKAYNAYAGILKRESDAAYNAIDELRIGPIAMPKDTEWTHFVQKDDHFVDPEIPVRSADQIHYPGQDHLTCQEIRAGLLERKSKYLKSYTAGWYVLSPTHLHEFKSADKAQAPVMSLYLPEQKLGSHSSEGGSSNKFILKGRQAGSMHRGHTWVFRAETHDTMMAWYEDVKALTEKTPQERSDFVRHTRSLSQSSRRSVSSDGVVDEEDDEPFSADTVVAAETGSKSDIRRPQPGGRFPSDIQVNAQRGLQAPLSPSSMSSGFENQGPGQDQMAAAGVLPVGVGALGDKNDSRESHQGYGNTDRALMDDAPSHATMVSQQAREDGINPYTNEPARDSQMVPNYDNNQYFNQSQTQNYVVPVAGVQRSSSQRSQRSQRSQTQSSQTNQNPGVIAPLVVGGDLQRHTSESQDRSLETPGGNGQYGQWMNGHSDSQRIDGVQPVPSQVAHQPAYQAANVHDTRDVSVKPVFVAAGHRNDWNGQFQQQPENHATDGSLASPTQANANYTLAQPQPVRPTSTNMRTDSVPTISNLHVPGEYPKATPTTESSDKRLA